MQSEDALTSTIHSSGLMWPSDTRSSSANVSSTIASSAWGQEGDPCGEEGQREMTWQTHNAESGLAKDLIIVTSSGCQLRWQSRQQQGTGSSVAYG